MTFLFCDSMIVVSLLNGSCLLQFILGSYRRKSVPSFMNITTITIFESIFLFHCSSNLKNGLQKNTLTMSQKYHLATLIRICVQHLPEARKKGFSKSLLTYF